MILVKFYDTVISRVKANLTSNEALMRSPNQISARSQTSARRVQEASFSPRGLGGQLYWYAVLPFHTLVFPTMIRNLIRSANRKDYAEMIKTNPVDNFDLS